MAFDGIHANANANANANARRRRLRFSKQKRKVKRSAFPSIDTTFPIESTRTPRFKTMKFSSLAIIAACYAGSANAFAPTQVKAFGLQVRVWEQPLPRVGNEGGETLIRFWIQWETPEVSRVSDTNGRSFILERNRCCNHVVECILVLVIMVLFVSTHKRIFL